LIPEIPAKDLVTLGAYIIQGGKGDTYQPLKVSLSKIQWVKFTSLRAIEIENELQKMAKPNKVSKMGKKICTNKRVRANEESV